VEMVKRACSIVAVFVETSTLVPRHTSDKCYVNICEYMFTSVKDTYMLIYIYIYMYTCLVDLILFKEIPLP